jgi:hypothetical protein
LQEEAIMDRKQWLAAAKVLTVMTVAVVVSVTLLAQGPQGQQGGGGGKGGGKGGGGKGGAPPAPAVARTAAPIDLTGFWVSLVTEDWLSRMVTPEKGVIESVPVTPAARAAAGQWDPAKDEAAGLQCKSYGAAALMRVPGRLNIDWMDDSTMRIQTDAGTQTRLLHFTGDVSGPRSLQGFSKASWEGMGRGGRGGVFGIAAGLTGDPAGPGGGKAAAPIRPGSLRVITTNLSAGYLRKNGVPYSETTVLSEWFDVVHEPDGTQYLIVTTVVEDPANLTQPFRTSTHFRKEADGAKFSPSPCTAK